MKYEVSDWQNEKKKIRRYTVNPPIPGGAVYTDHATKIVAEFLVHPEGDPERVERARMLATKVCAFLNELEEKKAQIAELMNIAGQ